LHFSNHQDMKKLVVVLLAAGLFACQSADKNQVKDQTKSESTSAAKDSANNTSIQWLDSTFRDIGKVKEGQVVEVTFRFKNTGSKNLIIQDVSASCGCTVPEKPGKPFAPGEEGVIKAKFDSKNRVGEARKNVYVKSNSEPNTQELSFRVEVTE
jgi:hypothetical protein